MTRFDPKKTNKYSRTFGPAKVNGKQSRLPLEASSLFHGTTPKQNQAPQPEEMGKESTPGSHLDRLIGLNSMGPIPEQ